MKIDEKRLVATFYKAPSEKEPVREWLKELSSTNKKVVGGDIKTVDLGGLLGCQYVGH